MGIWHNIIIDCQKSTTPFANKLVLYDSCKSISLDLFEGKLGLLSAPNSESFFYPTRHFQHISIAFDGRIYNKQKLCSTLNLDEEIDIGIVIIELYKTYGPDGIYRLDGAFSLILYDREKQMSLLYRSFLTGYPLYYVAKNNLLSVSTNPVSLLYRPDVSDTLDMEQMSAHFALDLTGWTDSIFSELTELEHGEMVMVTSEGIQSTKRALNEILLSPQYGSESEIIKTYRHLVKNTVKKSLLQNKRYGIMLSSGIDSSTLAFFASEMLKKQDSKLHAYSWSLAGYQAADETEKIKELCSRLEIELTLFDAKKFAPFSELDNLMLQPDIPFTNLFSPMISELYRKASIDGMDILFNGHYGDNLYPPTHDLFVDMIKDKRYELFFPTLKSVIARTGYRNAIRHSPSVRGFIRYLLPFYKFKKPVFHAPEWLSVEAKESRRLAWKNQNKKIEEGYETFASALSKWNTSSGMGRYSTGKFGIERIEPYTDVDLLNYTLRIPPYMAYRDGKMKYFAREAMRGLLPESIRTQGRVGLLNQFAHDGFIKNKESVRERLLDEREPWKVYVDEKWMEKKFKNISSVSDKDLLVIWMCLNIGPWQKAIKPGGSLYERDFMKENLKVMK